MALLYKLCCLPYVNQISLNTIYKICRTHRADRLRHFRHAHEHREAAAAERGDGELVDAAELGGRVYDAHVV